MFQTTLQHGLIMQIADCKAVTVFLGVLVFLLWTSKRHKTQNVKR